MLYGRGEGAKEMPFDELCRKFDWAVYVRVMQGRSPSLLQVFVVQLIFPCPALNSSVSTSRDRCSKMPII